MAWLAVHPSNTMRERLTDDPESPEFTFGFWPPRESERLSGVPFGSGDVYDGGRDMIRYGVRGWTGYVDEEGRPIEPKMGTATIDGKEHPVLLDESIDFLIANCVHVLVAQMAYRFNTLTPAQKKTSGLRLRLATSTAPTDAESAAKETTGSESIPPAPPSESPESGSKGSAPSSS